MERDMPELEMKIARVVIDRALEKPLDYAIPEEYLPFVRPGMRVIVPLRGKECFATILSLEKKSDIQNIRPLCKVLDDRASLSADLLQLAYWMADYYCTDLRRVLKTLLPPSIHTKIEPKKQLWVKSLCSQNELLALCEKQRQTPQACILDVMLKKPKGLLLSELLEASKCSRSPVATLAKKKILSCAPIEIERTNNFEFFQTKPKKLNDEQAECLEKIETTLSKEHYETHLIYGVTGSGKTEVYLQAIESALKKGKGVIFLVPEIALTSQTVERVKSRFQSAVALLHYRLSPGERADTRRLISEGKLKIVIGARSAIFSPVVDLGLIIVDEEHESSYKQTDEMPCYHARDVAVMRGYFAKACVLLGSATPSLESYQNSLTGKYRLSILKNRADSAELPSVTIVDMKPEFEKHKGFTLFSDALLRALKQRLEVGEQTLLFLNRRGFHSMRMCKACGHVIHCPHCDVSLTFHKGENKLSCHLCNYMLIPPSECPHCQSNESMQFKGAGTEQVERTLHALFPNIRTMRLDADTTRHKGSHEVLFKQFRSGKADVLVGTQMIAKGLHFPSVTLACVLNADSALHIPDFRSSETTFQLITQVAGRSGRGALAGEVIIQTLLADHSAIQLGANQDYDRFFEEEIKTRKLFDYPPFSRLIKFLFSGADQEAVYSLAQNLRKELLSHLSEQFQLTPVIECGIAKIKDEFRYQFFIKGKSFSSSIKMIYRIYSRFKSEKKIKLSVDVDPISLY
jgi:primosomal protein N' (replication factor Y) (superfamily II helicase)